MIDQIKSIPVRRRRLYILLIGIILATIPCYCAGFVALQRAPGQTTPEGPATSTLAATDVPLATSTSPAPEITVSSTPASATATRYVPPTAPPTATASITPTPSSTPTPTSTATVTETATTAPTLTDTPVPSETPTPLPTDEPTSE